MLKEAESPRRPKKASESDSKNKTLSASDFILKASEGDPVASVNLSDKNHYHWLMILKKRLILEMSDKDFVLSH